MDAMTADARMPSDREIVISRLIDAPQELVFDAWTDPEQVVQWWGPRGFTTTTHKMEVKPGGVWRFVMIEDVRQAVLAGNKPVDTNETPTAAALTE